jgi:sulfur dioxygenase
MPVASPAAVDLGAGVWVQTIRSLHGRALSYLLVDGAGREAALVDPQSCDLPLIRALLDERGLALRWVLRTHAHDRERPAELPALCGLGAPVVQGVAIDPMVMTMPDGGRLPLGQGVIRVWHTPGHTPDGLSFACQDRLFCGYLLDVRGCPWQRWPADPARLWDSVVHKVFTLPDDTLIYPGQYHPRYSVSTVHDQRRWHPFFAQCTRDAYLARLAVLAGKARERHG